MYIGRLRHLALFVYEDRSCGKATLKFLATFVLITLVISAGCVPSKQSSQDRLYRSERSSFINTFTIPEQKAPPQEIQSIQLYRKGAPGSAPIININSKEKLVLEFDFLGGVSKQFRVEVTHRDKNWEQSPLPPNFYLSGFNETYIRGGLSSFSQRPSYRHYEFEFPDSQLSFEVSGNYLLSVFDYNTNELFFTFPFFISENAGSLDTRIESIFARREDLRSQDQPFSVYRYPPFVEFPQFDLSFFYVQNQFWGRARQADNYDTSTPGVVNFHLSREKAFLGDYEFNMLDLRQLTADGRNILEVQKEVTPPKVILRRDIQAFSPVPRFAPDTRFGFPSDDRSASYANVQFRLETASPLAAGTAIYIAGDFNNWTLNDLNRMKRNTETGLWEGQAFIKEGSYAYKYVIHDKGRIDDLALDRSFRFASQNYLTMVYYKDPTRNFDRLLKVINTVGN